MYFNIFPEDFFRVLTKRGWLEAIPAKDRSKYDWRQSSDKVNDAEVLIEPFEAAKNYLESNRVRRRPDATDLRSIGPRTRPPRLSLCPCCASWEDDFSR